MAIRIQCSDCRKRIVIDDAFAGGACRCPFCSTIVMVPGGDEGAGPARRPESPTERPESPTERPAEPDGRPAEPGAESAPAEPKPKPPIDPNSVPVARADRTMTYAMFGAVALLAVAVVIGLVFALKHHDAGTGPGGNVAANSADPDDEEYEAPIGSDPFKTVVTGPAIAGDVALVPPVVYVLDGGHVMSEVFDSAIAISRVSALSLKPTDRFTVIISAHEDIKSDAGTPPPPFESATAARPRAAAKPAATDEPADSAADDDNEPAAAPEPAPVKKRAGKDLYLPGGWMPGNATSEKAFQDWVRDFQERDEAPRGQTDVLASIDAAIALKPRTIVIFTLKNLIENGQLSPEAAAVAAKAKAAGIPIVSIGLHKGSGVNDQVKLGLEKFSIASGSEARNYGFDRLQEWATEFYNR